jgi:hypothetical protein
VAAKKDEVGAALELLAKAEEAGATASELKPIESTLQKTLAGRLQRAKHRKDRAAETSAKADLAKLKALAKRKK